MEIRVIHEDSDLLVINKPPGIVVFPEKPTPEKTLVDYLLAKSPSFKNVGKPPRHGIVHRLDKDTSGILLVAKNNKSLQFLQKKFKEGRVLKKYLALIVGLLKNKEDEIETFIGRSPKDRKKQRAFALHDPQSRREGLRKAITKYKVLKKLSDGKNYYTLVEVLPKTGRKHQIRAHFVYLGHPIAGDKIYGFKNQPAPKGLRRHFLHASYLKIKLQNGSEKEFHCPLPEDLKNALEGLVKIE